MAGYVLVAKQGTQAPTSETDGTRVCPAIVAASTHVHGRRLSPTAPPTRSASSRWTRRSTARSPRSSSAAPNGKVTDVKAPAAVSKLKAKVSGHKVTLTWKNPADHDFDHVEITAGQRKPAALKRVQARLLGQGHEGHDHARGGPVALVRRGRLRRASAMPPTPAERARHDRGRRASSGPRRAPRCTARCKLTWPVAKGAKYYNVQVYAGKKRILVSWPAGRALQLPAAKLKRGTKYTWYVWPGLGAKAKAHYGKLIGRNVFTFTG